MITRIPNKLLYIIKYYWKKIRKSSGVITLGTLQAIYIFWFFQLFQTKSWKWISKPINPLDDKLKEAFLIYQYEKVIFIIAFSFLGIWISVSEIFEMFSLDLFAIVIIVIHCSDNNDIIVIDNFLFACYCQLMS